jgi:hypothetical protein
MNAAIKIYEKMNDQLYKKVGRKYVPVNDPFAYDGLREGWWLIKVAPGSTAIRSCLQPHMAELKAAAKEKEDELVQIIREASEAKPKEGVAMSDEARKDWKDFTKKHGDEFSTIYYPSFQENAEKIINALIH